MKRIVVADAGAAWKARAMAAASRPPRAALRARPGAGVAEWLVFKVVSPGLMGSRRSQRARATSRSWQSAIPKDRDKPEVGASRRLRRAASPAAARAARCRLRLAEHFLHDRRRGLRVAAEADQEFLVPLLRLAARVVL